MKTNEDILKEYRASYRVMRNRAIEVMKGYGKILEVHEEIKARILRENGLDKVPDTDTEDFDVISEQYDERKWSDVYSCVFEGKHEQVYIANIIMVRYNGETNDVDVYLESDDGYVSEWMPVSYIGFGQDNVYMTVLEYING